MSLKNVLVGVDLSFESEAAVLRAASLPLERGATLTILNVVDPEERDLDDTRLNRLAVEALVVEANRVRQEAGLAPVEVLSAIDDGVPAAEIAQHARALAADLIVLGHHRARSWIDSVVHRTANALRVESEIPLLVVEHAPAGPYRALLHAHDLDGSCDASLSLAREIVGDAVPAVTVVHAWELPPPLIMEPVTYQGREGSRRLIQKSARDTIARDLQALGPVAHDWMVVVREGKPGRVIVEEAVHRKSELIAMGTSARTGVGRAIFGSTAGYVLRHPPCDVLVVRP